VTDHANGHVPSAGGAATPRIAMITAGEMTEDPRARRAAMEAQRLGLPVEGLCVSRGPGLGDVPVVRVAPTRFDRWLREHGVPRAAPSSRAFREVRGIYRLGRHALVTARLTRASRTMTRCDVVHANDFDTLPAGALLARRWHARLVYDSHEIYTRQEPDPPRVYCAVVRRLEGALARRSEAVITVSEAFGAEITHELQLNRPPHLVLNCPAVVPDIPSASSVDVVRAIYQSATGPGRMPEDAVDAAAHIGGAHLTLRILGTDLGALRRLVAAHGLDEKVSVVEPVPANSLVEGLAGFQIGVMINRPISRNDELTLPNKLFEYMMAGLAVVAPDLPSVGTFVEREGVGITYRAGDAAALGAAIRRLAEDPALLAACSDRARRLALESYNAEAQGPVLARAWGLAA
jgi:glycosyltransferase involved in cell wall biosynthesis